MRPNPSAEFDIPPPPGAFPTKSVGNSSSLHFVSYSGGLPPALGNNGDLPARDARKGRLRHSAIQADRVRNVVQELGTRGKISVPTLASWCCGRSIIPAEGPGGKPTGAPGEAQVWRYEGNTDDPDARGDNHGLAGIQRCASPFVCPVCGRRIAAKRREDVAFTTSAMLQKGWSFCFITFTARHKYTDSLADFIDRFQESARKMRGTRQYKAFCERWHLDHSIRTAEVTLDHPDSKAKSGWHWHAHMLAFLNRPLLSTAEAEQMQSELVAMWQKACNFYGLHVDSKVGLTIERPHFKTKKGEVIYGDAENLIKVADYMAKNVSFEAAPAPSAKAGRKSERITSWQLFGLVALHGRKDLIEKLNEFICAIKGRRSIYFSRGLADLVGLNEETDEEALEGENGDVCVYRFEDEEFMRFASVGKTRAAMQLMDDGIKPSVVVAAYIKGIIDTKTLNEVNADHKLTALEVFDLETGEVLITNEMIDEFVNGDNPPSLTVVSPPDSKNQARPRPMAGILPKLPSTFKRRSAA